MRFFPWLLAIMIARPCSTGGQDAALAQEPPVFRSSSELVLLQVTVKDSRNRYLLGLPRDAFAVYHNGQPQEIRFFMDDVRPPRSD